RITFYDVASRHGTDKVTQHHYHHMYEKYLGPIRTQPLKVLEIGLGCDMGYGPGKSFTTWLEYLPNVDLYYLEYDAACAKKWEEKTRGLATVYTGDQADKGVLEQLVKGSGGEFDVVIDDGGHSMTQQINSFEVLWGAVKAGGVYFCEDMQTSFWGNYGGGEGGEGTFVGLTKELIGDLMRTGGSGDPIDSKHGEIWKTLRGVDCMVEVCAFVKKGEGEVD
ncbi:hypothetical protein K402DRAFT_328586, partial [Aulographum hederae CBS 113979]